jgi:uncharacterized protein YjbI with pentapeptide repeats
MSRPRSSNRRPRGTGVLPMANDEHVALLKQGVAAWNAWRRVNREVQPDLSEANLSKANLGKAKLYMADLSGANLSGANLLGASLMGAKLNGANLREANLQEADVSTANLDGADLSGASLVGATLIRADLGAADLREAKLGASPTGITMWGRALGGTNFGGANLDGANLQKADLRRADLNEANLHGARLGEADLRKADLRRANLRDAKLSKAKLGEANLTHATLVHTDLTGADLTGCRIYGVSAWGVKISEDTKQHNLIITPDDESAVMVDDLEVAQFVYLLLDREKIRNVMDAVTRRGVLILGRFGDGGLALLQALAAWLRKPENGGYLPLLFDFPRPEAKTYTDTIRTLAGLARFVIVDLSGPSVPQEIMATVDLYEIPFVPILEQKRTDWSMFRDFLVKERVLKPIRFTNQDHLLELLADKVIAPAEKLIEERQRRLDKIFGRARTSVRRHRQVKREAEEEWWKP